MESGFLQKKMIQMLLLVFSKKTSIPSFQVRQPGFIFFSFLLFLTKEEAVLTF